MADQVLNRKAALNDILDLLPAAGDSFLLDLLEDLKRKPAKTIGEGRDIVVTVRPGLDKYEIGMIQQIEGHLDKALNHSGFTRSKSGKYGHKVEFVYYQFAVCGEKR